MPIARGWISFVPMQNGRTSVGMVISDSDEHRPSALPMPPLRT